MASWVATLILDLATGIFKALGGDLEAYMAEKQREAANAKAVNDALQKKDQSGIETAIGNPGFRTFRYRVTWKGDTVIRMTPLGDMPMASSASTISGRDSMVSQ